MKIHFMSPCPFTEAQMQRLTFLISQRMCLLLGDSVIEKISNVVFSHDIDLDTEEGIMSKNVNGYNKKSNIDIIISYNILFSMLHPGNGQAVFDDAILKTVNVMNNISY